MELRPDQSGLPSSDTGNPLKEFVLEGVLRRLNLTSYRRLEFLRKHLAAILEDRAAERENLLHTIASLNNNIEQLQLEKRLLESHLYWKDRHSAQSPAVQDRGAPESLETTLELIRNRLASPEEVSPIALLLLDLYREQGDPILDQILSIYRQVIESKVAYWDVRKSVRVASSILQPKNYLEIGTRTGWSLSQVFSTVPDVHAYVFDLWIEDFGGRQGSAEFVRRKMQSTVGENRTPHVEFISGNSHDTLPDFFAGRLQVKPPTEFDIVVVDGDHSTLGAWWDLTDVIPHIKIGGALIFDDIDMTEEIGREYTSSDHKRPEPPPNMRNLVDVWRTFQEHYPNFHYFSCETYSARAGVAIRMS